MPPARSAAAPRVKAGLRQTTYTNAVGVALGVVGTNIPFDPTTYVAELRGLRAFRREPQTEHRQQQHGGVSRVEKADTAQRAREQRAG